jgi:putative CocE/NonD family hydrolase
MNENPFQQEIDKQKIKYRGFKKNSYYITMRDSVKIALDVVLPKDLPPNAKIPAILYQTRYWRSYEFKKWISWILKDVPERIMEQKVSTGRGYAFVKVDVRGTGASFGSRPHPWSEEEVEDGREIIDWIISQPWSDGNIVTYGSSYPGITAELVATLNHPAVKGIIPMHNYFDLYTDIASPGGIFNEFFINHWANIGRYLDKNSIEGLLEIYPILKYIVKGVVPVESDKDRTILKKAMQAHSSNTYVSELTEGSSFRDDTYLGSKEKSVNDLSIFTRKDQIEKSKLPIFSWGGWLDGTSADVVIKRFVNFGNPQIAVIGDWNHSVRNRANLYFPKDRKAKPNKKIQVDSCLDFFDDCISGKPIKGKILYYYTMAEEKWKKTHIWPPEGTVMEKWYFNQNFMLSQNKPQDDTGSDTYAIDFETTTGKGNRWYTNIGLKTFYENRAEVDSKLLTYTSEPLKEDMEITGHPIITLFLTSTHEDGAIFAYLEDIDENGNVTYITEGELRVIHRKISDETPPYKETIPYHTFRKNDNMSLTSGEMAETNFGFLPTSVLIRKNHKIRIAIAGADKDTFTRYPEKGNPVIIISRDKEYSSFIELPIINIRDVK